MLELDEAFRSSWKEKIWYSLDCEGEGRKAEIGFCGKTANCSLNLAIKPGKKALASLIVEIPARWRHIFSFLPFSLKTCLSLRLSKPACLRSGDRTFQKLFHDYKSAGFFGAQKISRLFIIEARRFFLLPLATGGGKHLPPISGGRGGWHFLNPFITWHYHSPATLI